MSEPLLLGTLSTCSRVFTSQINLNGEFCIVLIHFSTLHLFHRPHFPASKGQSIESSCWFLSHKLNEIEETLDDDHPWHLNTSPGWRIGFFVTVLGECCFRVMVMKILDLQQAGGLHLKARAELGYTLSLQTKKASGCPSPVYVISLPCSPCSKPFFSPARSANARPDSRGGKRVDTTEGRVPYDASLTCHFLNWT